MPNSNQWTMSNDEDADGQSAYMQLRRCFHVTLLLKYEYCRHSNIPLRHSSKALLMTLYKQLHVSNSTHWLNLQLMCAYYSCVLGSKRLSVFFFCFFFLTNYINYSVKSGISPTFAREARTRNVAVELIMENNSQPKSWKNRSSLLPWRGIEPRTPQLPFSMITSTAAFLVLL